MVFKANVYLYIKIKYSSKSVKLEADKLTHIKLVSTYYASESSLVKLQEIVFKKQIS